MQVEDAERDIVIANLWDAGATGITEEDHQLRAFFDAESDRKLLVTRFADYKPAVQDEEDRDWVRMAQSQWQPFSVGERFYLVPEWLDDPAPEGRLRLRMHPGMACGSGTHPATRLCLIAMERYVKPGQAVLDVGTGAGILADGARLLGASPVIGCDIEHEATVVARGNLDSEIGLFTGSTRSLKSSAVDWAVCNLNAATLANVKTDLLRISQGLILSGFSEDETDKVAGMYKRAIREQMELDGYGCLVI
jgi:ribosomal protein L11 methyltransferase